ncbi:isopeptide-forming domain-containing fimbrial protein, partial [uncultured Enterococcus sp.]|uniref:isopeptide-forming domain-containing fimbrial protein n=1 Tax=uncultured Enterococcus sp. TaxID=167972 RepID=UPI0025EE1FE7
MHLFKKTLKSLFLLLILMGVGLGVKGATIQAVDESASRGLNADGLYEYTDKELGVGFTNWQNDGTISFEQEFLNLDKKGKPASKQILTSIVGRKNLYQQINTITIRSLSKDTVPYYSNSFNAIAVKGAEDPTLYAQSSRYKNSVLLSNSGTGFFYDVPFDTNTSAIPGNKGINAGPSITVFPNYATDKQSSFNIYLNPNQSAVPSLPAIGGASNLQSVYFSQDSPQNKTITATMKVNLYYLAANSGTENTLGSIGYTGNPSVAVPQMTKILYRDVNNPKQDISPSKTLGQRKEAGGTDTGMYMEPLSASSIPISGYTYKNYQVLLGRGDKNDVYTSETRAVSADTTWEGAQNTSGKAHRYIIFYYEKKPDTGTIKKSNDKKDTGVVVNSSTPDNIVTYTLNVTNTSDHDVKGFEMQDTLPSGMSNITNSLSGSPSNVQLNGTALSATSSTSNDYYSYSATNNTLSVKLNKTAIKPQETVKITYQLKVKTGTVGEQKKNTVILKSSTGETLDKAGSTFSINEPPSGILTKTNTAASALILNQPVTYTLNATNTTSATTFNNAKLVDVLPNNLASPTNIKLNGIALKTTGDNYYELSGQKLTVHFKTIAPKQVMKVTYDTYPTAVVSPLVNNADFLLSDDTSLAKAKSTVNVVDTKGSVTKVNDATAPILANSMVNYTITATNESTVALSKFKLVDTLPSGVALTKDSTISVAGTKISSKADLENSGGNVATSDYYEWNSTSQILTVYFNKTTLNPNANVKVVYSAQASKPGTHTNTVEFKDPNNKTLGNASSEIQVYQASLTKTNDKAKTGAIVGQTVTYTLTANNLASSAGDIKGSFIYDDLPTGMGVPQNVYLQVIPSGTSPSDNAKVKLPNTGGSTTNYYTLDNNKTRLTIHFNGTTFKPGDQAVITYESVVTAGNTGDTKKNSADWRNSKSTSMAKADSTFPIVAEAFKASLTKTNDKATSGTVRGQDVTYTLSVKNDMTYTNLEDAYVQDTFPTDMSKPKQVTVNNVLISQKNAQDQTLNYNYYTWDSGILTVYLQGASIAPGKTAEIKYTTTLASLSTTSSDAEKQAVKKENTAKLFSVKKDELETAKSEFPIIKGELTKTNDQPVGVVKVTQKKGESDAAYQTRVKNDTIEYTLKFKNTSLINLSNTYIKDKLPEGLSEPKTILLNGKVLANGDTAKLENGYLIINLNYTVLQPNVEQTLTYKAYVTSDEVQSPFVNTAELFTQDNHSLANSESTVNLFKGSIVKENNKPNGAFTGDVVHYTIDAKNAENSSILENSYIKDKLPTGMSTPTNIMMNGKALVEFDKDTSNTENRNNTDTYEFDTKNNILIIHINGSDIAPGETVKIEYDSTITAINSGEVQKVNTATFYKRGSRDANNKWVDHELDTDNSTVKLVKPTKTVKLNIKQEYFTTSQNNRLVYPKTGYFNLKNLSTASNQVVESYSVTSKSYAIDSPD